MKRFLSVTLALVLSLSLFAGCGSTSSSGSAASGGSSSGGSSSGGSSSGDAAPSGETYTLKLGSKDVYKRQGVHLLPHRQPGLRRRHRHRRHPAQLLQRQPGRVQMCIRDSIYPALKETFPRLL